MKKHDEDMLNDEIIVSTLKHSSIPTIIVEGKDDLIIYRWIETEMGINVFPCGGRTTLLKVFERRAEFQHINTIFVADKDTFVYSGIPKQYDEIIFTTGYSIENDLYAGRKIEQLLDKDEKAHYEKAKKNFIRYYACQLERFQEGEEFDFEQHPNQILDNEYNLKEEQVNNGFIEPKAETIDYLTKGYDLLMRGHSIFQLLLKFLSYSNRPVKHSALSLYEQCFKYKSFRTRYIVELTEKIKTKISPQ